MCYTLWFDLIGDQYATNPVPTLMIKQTSQIPHRPGTAAPSSGAAADRVKAAAKERLDARAANR